MDDALALINRDREQLVVRLQQEVQQFNALNAERERLAASINTATERIRYIDEVLSRTAGDTPPPDQTPPPSE